MFARIRWRLVAWTVAVLATILLVLGGVVYLTLSRSLMAEVDRVLAVRADELGRRSRGPGEDGRVERPGYRGGVFVLVLDPAGRVLANPQGVDLTGLDLPAWVAGAPGYRTEVVDGETVRLYVQPRQDPTRGPALLVIGQTLTTLQQTLQRLVWVLVVGGGAGLLLSLLAAWFLAGRALVPIQLAFLRQQEFVADASHELRTPLTVLRSAAELLNQHRDEPLAANGELFDDIRAEIARLERLAADLLTLARSDQENVELATAEFELGPLAADVVRHVLPLARERRIELTYRGDAESLLVDLDPDRLRQVLLILLDNAMKHTPAGGRISVSLTQHGHAARLEVADTGEGIPGEHLPRVFDRFYRAGRDQSRADEGSGLGLAIAKSLVEAQGGQLALSSTPGDGTTARLRFPLARRSPALADRVGQLAARIAQRPVRR